MTTPAATAAPHSLLLPGLDGTNPLGFLAALGLLRTLDTQDMGKPVQMQWEQVNGTWTPRIFNGGSDVDELLNHLKSGFGALDSSPWTIGKKMPFEADRLRDESIDAISTSSQSCRDRIDTLASFGVECIRNDDETFGDTSLRMVRAGDSAGNGLLAYGKRILDETEEGDLRSALTDSWTLNDERCALRWDPSEFHGYATQWTNPSAEKTVSTRGGNRLALAAMPMLPTIPCGAKVGTVSFGRPDGKNECLSWPLWCIPCSVDVVKSLLALPGLHDKRPSPPELLARGIAAVYRCERVMTSTYYRNFTPAQRIA